MAKIGDQIDLALVPYGKATVSTYVLMYKKYFNICESL